MARLKEQYVNEIAPALNSKFGYKSVMQIPKLDKVVINVACGEAKDNEKILEAVMKDLGQITGQKAVVCRAKKSVANFKLRQGTPIGCKVTLRGERMYEFVDRFFNIALPRVRDFRGINGNGFDGRGNFACGIKEQIIFPEIDFEKVDAVRGMDVCFVTTLDRQRSIEVDAVIAATGLRPETALARRAGLTINRGVCVDSYLQTSNTDIYALGDCAEINGQVLPFLQPIQLSAMVLAKNLLGNNTPLKLPAMLVKIKTPELPLHLAGETQRQDLRWQINTERQGMVARGVDDADQLRAFVVSEDRMKEAFGLLKTLPM